MHGFLLLYYAHITLFVGSGTCPPEIVRAKRIQRLIESHCGVVDLHDDGGSGENEIHDNDEATEMALYEDLCVQNAQEHARTAAELAVSPASAVAP